MIGSGLEPVVLPRHVYERMMGVLREVEGVVPGQEVRDRVRAAMAFGEQLRGEGMKHQERARRWLATHFVTARVGKPSGTPTDDASLAAEFAAVERETIERALEAMPKVGSGSWGNADEDRGWDSACKSAVAALEGISFNSAVRAKMQPDLDEASALLTSIREMRERDAGRSKETCVGVEHTSGETPASSATDPSRSSKEAASEPRHPASSGERAVLRSLLGECSAALERYARHRYCEDGWYACPKHPEYCGQETLTDCDCGADVVAPLLAKVQAHLTGAPPVEGAPAAHHLRLGKAVLPDLAIWHRLRNVAACSTTDSVSINPALLREAADALKSPLPERVQAVIEAAREWRQRAPRIEGSYLPSRWVVLIGRLDAAVDRLDSATGTHTK